MNEEINRVLNLLSRTEDVEIVNNNEVQKAGFQDIEDYNFVLSAQKKFDTFMQYIEEWEGLEERIPTIQRTFILVQLLRGNNINV